MVIYTNRWEAISARTATELHCYDKELLGANWKPAIGVLALSCGHTDKELRPKLPEDSTELAPGFVTQLRVLASRI